MGKSKAQFTIQHKKVNSEKIYAFKNQQNFIWEVVGDIPNYQQKGNDYQLLIYGDCINPEVFFDLKEDFDNCLQKAKGHFTLVVVYPHQLKIMGSYFSFLPVYYCTSKKAISNSWDLIEKYTNRGVSVQFMVESHLFNYPLGNTTLYKDILLLNSFEMLTVEEGFSFECLTQINSWFNVNVKDEIDLKMLAERFIENIKSYFTSDKELITFTSGFDGRIILANALANNKPVQTFSMGRLENDDVVNPKQNAQELKIEFDTLDLAGSAYLDKFFESAKKLSKISGGRNGFLYPHFLYCSEHYSIFETLQTGYCGSELFRALHVAGAVTSQEMVEIFFQEDDDKLFDKLFSSKRLRFFKPSVIDGVKSDVWRNVQDLRQKKDEFVSANHFFYSFIFKEVFRKVFGFWTNAQFDNLTVRTPFLDFNFIQMLLKSEFAGCNNDFFTHNPLKRYKGQLLYAQILKELNSPLLHMMTGKKYKPSQLITRSGQLSIVIPYVIKKIRKRKGQVNLDNLGLITGFRQSWDVIDQCLNVVSPYYSLEAVRESVQSMHPSMSEVERDMLFQIASLCITLQHD